MIELKINNFPFYWRINSKINVHPYIPSKLPYSFGVMKSTNLLIENRNKKLLAHLNKVYKEDSNIGFLKNGHSLAKGYGDDFFKFLKYSIKYLKGKKILEIGCGDCYLLEKLKKLKYEVYGVDPAPITKRAQKEKSITIIEDFYPSKKINFKFDMIFHVDVLEHIPDPLLFLKKHYNNLNDNGYVVINVPDVTEGVALGDISIATHQHLNSFTIKSLSNIVEKAGLNVIKIKKSGFGGSLYCLASKKILTRKRNNDLKSVDNETIQFFKKSKNAIRKFNNILDLSLKQEKTIGFYMPLRAFPYIASYNSNFSYRLFDDQKHWHKKYIDGEKTIIENFQDLVKKPVDHLFVMSITFGQIVKKKVLKKIPDIKVTLIKEILNGKKKKIIIKL